MGRGGEGRGEGVDKLRSHYQIDGLIHSLSL